MAMTKSEAGKLGGLATKEKYGVEYLKEIGSRGGRAMHDKYRMVPVNQNDFAYVDRVTGEVVALQYGNLYEHKRFK